MIRIRTAATTCALGLALACGGGGGGQSQPNPTPTTWASTLVYTDPVATGFRLVKNPTLSTPTKVVLDLMGPSGQTGQGVAFMLKTDAALASWTQPPGASGLVQNVAFDLGSGTPALVGKDKGSGVLEGAIFQKSGSSALGQPLARVSLSLKSGVVPVNASIPLSFTAGNTLSGTGTVTPITLAVGTLVAK